MTTDRTKPAPFVEVSRGSDGLWDAWSTIEISTMHRPGCATEAEAIALSWADYDAITLPARVALLRELAAELRRLADDEPQGAPPNWYAMAQRDIADEYTVRADALEATRPKPRSPA